MVNCRLNADPYGTLSRSPLHLNEPYCGMITFALVDEQMAISLVAMSILLLWLGGVQLKITISPLLCPRETKCAQLS